MISKKIEYRKFFFLQLILKKVKLSYFTFITCKEKHFKRFLSENCQKPSQRSSSASSSSSSGSRPDCSSSSLPTWEGKYSHSMASGTLERCSLHRWMPIFTVQGRWQTACMASCGWAVCWCQRCGSSGPWWRWGYGMGRLWLWTTNTLLMTFECTVTWSWGPLLCHSSTDHHLILQYDNALPHVAKICTQFLEAENIPVLAWPALTGHDTHWACLGCSGSAYTTPCSSSRQYPATSHSHWRGVDQHSTGHNQQPDQLYAKEMCCTAQGKWWSHQILTGFRSVYLICTF